MRDSVFGEAPDAERKRQIKVVWPYRPVNQIEWELTIAMYEALALADHRAPIIWIDDDELANADAYGALSVRDAMTLQDIVRGEVCEVYRRALIVAGECGKRATLADYLVACAAEGINPLSERLSKCQ